MIRLDITYFFDLVKYLHQLGRFKFTEIESNKQDLLFPTHVCLDKVNTLLDRESVYNLIVSYRSMKTFKEKSELFHEKYDEGADEIKTYVYELISAAIHLETSLKDELSIQPIYLVSPKGGYDVNLLTVRPEIIFPEGLIDKYPKLTYDVKHCSLALAFSLPSACIFHLTRILEFLVREYHFAKGLTELKNPSLGSYLDALIKECKNLDNNKEEIKNPDNNRLIDSLKSIKDNIRNPIIHPDNNKEEIKIEDAITIFHAVYEPISLLMSSIGASSNIRK